LFPAGAEGASPDCVLDVGSDTEGKLDGCSMPIATRRAKSGVTAKSVNRMGVVPQESRTFPSASCKVAEEISIGS